MTLKEYQERAMTTCMPTSDNFAYMFLNLVGEVGEFASKVAKAVRKGYAGIGVEEEHNQIWFAEEEYPRLIEELQKEAGDILWQLSGLCTNMGWSLEEVAQMNLDKLAQRKINGTIDGNGDGVGLERLKDGNS